MVHRPGRRDRSRVPEGDVQRRHDACRRRSRLPRLIDDYPAISGLYQLAGPLISKYDLLASIRDALDLDITIVPEVGLQCSTGHLSATDFVAATGIEAPSWTDMITDMANDPTPYEETEMTETSFEASESSSRGAPARWGVGSPTAS